MDLLSELFEHLCGRGRCFVVGGAVLPVCQRCLGLYVAAALTAAWVVAARLWRRGLPPWPVLVCHLLLLAGAMLGGLHVLDFGALWRLICGLATGHVLILWLVLGAAHLWRAGRVGEGPRRGWGCVETVPALGAVILLGIGGAVAALVPGLRRLGEGAGPGAVTCGAASWAWGFWTILAGAGAAALAVSVVCALAMLVRYVWEASLACCKRTGH